MENVHLRSTCTRVTAPLAALPPFLLSQEGTGVRAGASRKSLKLCALPNNSSSNEKPQKFYISEAKTIDPDNHIYTKLVTFPSREISRITHSFSKSSNKIGSSFFAEQCNLRWLGAASTATLTKQS
jgi:hypothetical protein